MIDKAILRIQEASSIAQTHGNILICCDSGGKDSSVLIDLCIKSEVPFEVHHNHTTVDAPETVYFIRENHERLKAQKIPCKINKPKLTMWELIVRKLMPPTRLVRYCCEYLKERRFDNQHLLLGVRWAESNNRIATNPIIDWSNRELWEYIRKNNLKINPLYECGFSRVGCVGCPMSSKNVVELEKYPKYKEAYINAFDKMIAERKRKGLQRNTSWQDGESVYKWWINPKFDPEYEKRIMTLEEII
jgi:phosphoadenosine phosphosulfate reductase